MPKKKRKIEGTPEPAATPLEPMEDDTELIAVITAAIAAARAEETSVPVITSVRERKIPEPAMAAARDTEIPEAALEEETIDSADSFVVRTIKRRGPAKKRKEFGL